MYSERARTGQRAARRRGSLRVGRLLAALVLGAALLVFFYIRHGSGAPQPPAAGGPPHTPISVQAAAHKVVFGFADPRLLVLPPAEQQSRLLQMKATGITSVRFDADWASVQPTSPYISYWARIDQAVSSARAAGMSVDLIIDGCPPWASVAGTNNYTFSQPASPSQFAAYAAQVAERYAPQGVRYFEIWNEPNLRAFWRPKPNPAAFAADLAAAYSAIKKADHSAYVVAGGLGPAKITPVDYRPVAFLQAMYAHGAEGKFDALGFHPYSFPMLPDTPVSSSGWSQMNYTYPSLRSVMAAHGDQDKPIWLTEFGAPVKGPAGIGSANQALTLAEGIRDAKSTPWIGAVYIFSWQDYGTDPLRNGDWFGLLTAQGTRRPSYRDVRKAIRGR